MKLFHLFKIFVKNKTNPYSVDEFMYGYKLPPQKFSTTKFAKIWLDALVKAWKQDTGNKDAEVISIAPMGITYVQTSEEGTDPKENKIIV